MITAPNGESVTVHSDNWMMALGKAMGFFNEDGLSMVRWVCTPGTGGVVTVEDPVADKSWTVKPLGMVLKVVVNTPQREYVQEEVEEPRRKKDEDVAIDADAPPPPPLAPVKSSLEPPPLSEEQVKRLERAARRRTTEGTSIFSPDVLTEKLWDLSTDFAIMGAVEQCQRVLQLVAEYVPAEASSVARGSMADFHLTIVAATGPVSGQLVNRVVPFGEGLVGLCFDARMPVQVDDARHDERHFHDLDRELGFETRAVLCVPIMHKEQIFGVIQVINPEDPFEPEHVEVLQTIAATLAKGLQDAAERD